MLVEHGARNVPLLVALVNLLALGQGVVPVHASTVVHRGRTLLACGWSKGGKTEMMVALEREGATYVADEWSYLRRDGDRTLARSLPEPVRVWHWQLAQLPELRERVTSRKKRSRLTALDRTSGLLSSMSERGLPGRDVWRRAAPVLARQAYVQVPPARLFDGRVADEAAVDQVLLVHSRPGDETRVSPVEGSKMRDRMRHWLDHGGCRSPTSTSSTASRSPTGSARWPSGPSRPRPRCSTRRWRRCRPPGWCTPTRPTSVGSPAPSTG